MKCARFAKTFFLLLILIGVAHGQSSIKIQGYVLDAESGKPLAGANVIVENTTFGAATDANGHFVIENIFTGVYSVKAGCIGYAPQIVTNVKVNNDEPARLSFRLQKSVIEMEAITVSARRDRSQSDPDMVVFTKTDIERSQRQSVADLLKMAGGIIINENGSDNSQTVSVRGSVANQVLILIDGVRLNNGLSGKIDLSTIPLSSVQRIEVRKGASANIYGEGALAASINIITKIAGGNKIKVNGGIGSFGRQMWAPEISGQKGHFSYITTFEQSSADGDYAYENPAGKGESRRRINSDWRNRNFYVHIGWKKRKYRLGAFAQLFRSDRGMPGRTFQLSPYARAETARNVFRLKCDWRSLKFQLGYSGENSHYLNKYIRSQVPVAWRAIPVYDNENKLRQFTAHSTWEQDLQNGKKMRAEIEFRTTDFKDKDLLRVDSPPVGLARRASYGAVLQYEMQSEQIPFLNSAAMRTSLRFDAAHTLHQDMNDFTTAWNPFLSLSFSKKALLLWRLSTSWGKSFRLPTYADLFYQQYQVRGNPNLLPEKSTSHEACLSVGWHLLGDGLVRVNYFKNDVQNLIIWEMGSFATFTPINTNALLAGEEYELNWNTKGRMVQLAFSHTRLFTQNLSRERTTHGKGIPYRPTRSTKCSLQLNFHTFYLDYNWRIIGARFVTAANTVKMPEHQVHDLTAGIKLQVKTTGIVFRISAFNFTNVSYQLIESSPLPGREWRVGVQVER
ncbi:MAG: TonB-dependent receptor [Actinobacteria bacterium]|nr:TonB-dependent receptor [Actinomycetota bacterium]